LEINVATMLKEGRDMRVSINVDGEQSMTTYTCFEVGGGSKKTVGIGGDEFGT
jgi:hypothetical protein